MQGTSRRPLHHYIVFLIALAVVGLATYYTLTFEPVSRKLIAASYYAETYYKKLQPKPVLPTRAFQQLSQHRMKRCDNATTRIN